MGMSKKDMHKHRGEHDEKMAELEAAAASGSDRARKKLVKENRKGKGDGLEPAEGRVLQHRHNAIKHSTGELVVRIKVGRASGEGKDQVRVSIEDNGPGIPDDRKAKVFDRSLMGLTKPVSRGLGLYLVKRLVEDYGGSTWVEDRVPGDHTQGARFVVLPPRATEEMTR